MNRFDECKTILEKSVIDCESQWIALSGGLDSSILSVLLKDKKMDAITIITKDFLGTDLTFSQIIAKNIGMDLSLIHATMEQILDSINETIKILKNFNDIEIRNSIVPYLYLKNLNEKNITSVITGDGADEIFAGYNFLLTKSETELEKELQRMKRIMHFPSKKIAESFKMKVETPFLNNDVIAFAENIPVKEKISEKNGKKYGKWILRKTFEKSLPENIVWREKSPMQDGSGTSNLTNLFNTIITNDIFIEKKNKILDEDGVYIRTKESLHYYECFKKFHGIPVSKNDKKCPDCNYSIETDSRFCRMCGKFPII